MRVLIIGAGLGGLTLLHGLRAGGVDARVYERTPLNGAQPASYGIHLNSDGLAALHACLPADNWAMIDAAGIPAPNIIRFRDPSLRVLSTVDKQFPEHATDPITKRRAISRGKLRNALLHGTDSPSPNSEGTAQPLVHWGKKFTHYEPTPAGVRAYFEDGTHADCDILVGADGSNSKVRRQRLPHVQREELGITNIAGRTPLSGAVAAALPADLTDGGINNIVPATGQPGTKPGSGWMFASTWDTGDPDIADVSGGAARYVIWAWAGATAAYPSNLTDLDGIVLQRLVQDRIASWAKPLQTMVDLTDPSTITTVPLRSMPQLPLWEPGNVTLLGDAIHNMTPMAGIGANTALRDAEQLRSALTGDHATIPAAVGQYEAAMRCYANQALALSTRNASNAALASPVNRTAFRTLLRAGSAIPPLKNKMFGPTRAATTASAPATA